MKGMFVFVFVVEDEEGRKRNCWGVRSYLNAIGTMSYFCDISAELELVRATRCDDLQNMTE